MEGRGGWGDREVEVEAGRGHSVTSEHNKKSAFYDIKAAA
jgi:hypothetical protein